MKSKRKGGRWRIVRHCLSAAALFASGCASTTRPADIADVCPQPNLPQSRRFSVIERSTGLPRYGQWRDGFALADMNGDGWLDLVHGPARKGRPTPNLFLGNAKGEFHRWTEAHFPPLPYDYGDVAVGDVNRDGVPDIALASHLRGLTVLIAEGKGQFAPWAEGLEMRAPGPPSEKPVVTSRTIALTDWNLDGRLDLLAVSEGPARLAPGFQIGGLVVFLNRDGLWQRITDGPQNDFFGSSIAVGNLNGDRFPDAVVGSAVLGFRDVLRLGTGTGWRAEPIRGLPAQTFITAVALASAGSRDPDDVLAGSESVVGTHWCVAFEMIADGGRGGHVPLYAAADQNAITSIATGDLDGDAQSEIVASRADGSILLFPGAGKRRFTKDLVIQIPEWLEGCRPFHVAVADLDGDGRGEIVASYAGETSFITGSNCSSGGGFATWSVQSIGKD